MSTDNQQDPEDRGLSSNIGPIEINWPQTLGYYGGIAAAVTFGVIEMPLGVFIAAVPVFKILSFPQAPTPVRFVSQILEGASKPVGGDSSAAVRVNQSRMPRAFGGIWNDAKALARGSGNGSS